MKKDLTQPRHGVEGGAGPWSCLSEGTGQSYLVDFEGKA